VTMSMVTLPTTTMGLRIEFKELILP